MIRPLEFGKDKFAPNVRMLYDMKNVLYDQEWLKTASNFPVYFFFRNLYLNEKHKMVAKKHGIQYDITVIPPRMLGAEFTKTVGHHHPLVPGTTVSYPELYQVLEGKATCLLHKEENGNAKDVIIIHASAGDIVIIPPHYSHITINETKKTLKMSNWVSSSFTSVYDKIAKKKGGVYYILANGKIMKNSNYGDAPLPLFMHAPDFKKIFRVDKDIYELIGNPKRLEFLTQPQNHMNLFAAFGP